jgi:hypothetical protein
VSLAEPEISVVYLSTKAKLVKERDSLVQTSKKLARDLAKVTTGTPFCDHILALPAF